MAFINGPDGIPVIIRDPDDLNPIPRTIDADCEIKSDRLRFKIPADAQPDDLQLKTSDC